MYVARLNDDGRNPLIHIHMRASLILPFKMCVMSGQSLFQTCFVGANEVRLCEGCSADISTTAFSLLATPWTMPQHSLHEQPAAATLTAAYQKIMAHLVSMTFLLAFPELFIHIRMQSYKYRDETS